MLRLKPMVYAAAGARLLAGACSSTAFVVAPGRDEWAPATPARTPGLPTLAKPLYSQQQAAVAQQKVGTGNVRSSPQPGLRTSPRSLAALGTGSVSPWMTAAFASFPTRWAVKPRAILNVLRPGRSPTRPGPGDRAFSETTPSRSYHAARRDDYGTGTRPIDGRGLSWFEDDHQRVQGRLVRGAYPLRWWREWGVSTARYHAQTPTRARGPAHLADSAPHAAWLVRRSRGASGLGT